MKAVHALWMILLLAGAADGRSLPVPEKSGWKHAASGIVIPARLAGAARQSIEDRGVLEADLVLKFAGNGVTIAANLFRAPIPRVPIWHDRLVQSLGISPAGTVRFTSPNAPRPDSLRVVAADGSSGVAVAIVPRGGWLLSMVIRAPDTIIADRSISAALAAVGWGFGAHGEEILPIELCPQAFAVSNARMTRTTAGDIIDDTRSAMNGLTRDKQPDDLLIYCRDPQPLVEASIYRGVEPDGYLIALKESGRVVIVTSSLAHDDAGKIVDRKRYMVAVKAPDYRALFRSFASTPTPQQAIAETRRTPLSFMRDGMIASKGRMSLPVQ